MKLMLLQLSDIHLKGDARKNPILARAERIAQAVLGVPDDVDGYVIVMSGDTASSGKAAEYQHAIGFYSSIVQTIAKQFPKKPIIFALVPGNHDCNFESEDSTRSILLSKLQLSDLIDAAPISLCQDVQSDYIAFVDQLTAAIPQARVIGLKGWFESKTEPICERTIQFHLLNSAWCSKLHETQGQLLFPVALWEENTSDKGSADVVLAVLHHPYNWLPAENARALRAALDGCSDLVLTGHEHDALGYSKATTNGETIEYLEGGVLQDSSDGDNSHFAATLLDIGRKELTVHFFHWSEGHYTSESVASARPFQRNQKRLASELPHTEEFDRLLDDPGASFAHPRKTSLVLSDFFIFPDFKEIASDEAENSAFIRGDEAVSRIVQFEQVLIIGSDTSGKTALSKTLTTRLRSMGFLPLFVAGGDLKLRDPENAGKALGTAMVNQYGSSQKERYEQLPKDRRAIIIDDYHLLNLNEHGKARFLEYVIERYKLVIVIAGDESRFEELTRQKGDRRALIQLKHLEIMELGYALRSRLIRQWHALGQEYSVPKDEVDAKVNRSERQINALLGEQFMPSYPLIVLIALQQLEVQDNITSATDSIGHLYEFLINRSLLASVGQTNADTNENYLSEFAWHLYKKGDNRITNDMAHTFHEWYCSTYKLRFEYTRQWRALVDAELLDDHGGAISFKYPYLYYYFVAHYLAAHISAPEIQQKVRVLATYLHQPVAANIVLFLCHLSKHPIVLESVMATADALFRDYTPCDLDKDVKFLNELVLKVELDVRFADKGSPEERRQELLEASDDQARREPKERESEELTVVVVEHVCDMQQLNDQLQLNGALKTIQIIGQILRNHVGSLRGDIKRELVSKCYSLGLRATKCLFEVLGVNMKDLVEALFEALQRRQGAVPRRKVKDGAGGDTLKLRTEVNKSVWGTLELGTFAIIKYITESVGTEHLAETFAEVLSADRSVSLELIDLSVKLDHFKGFPESETLALAKRLHKNQFTFTVLRDLIWTRFYVYRVDYKVRQRIAAKLKFSTKSQQAVTGRAGKKLSHRGFNQGPRRLN